MWPFDDWFNDPIEETDNLVDGLMTDIGALAVCSTLFIVSILILSGRIPVPYGIAGKWAFGGATIAIGVGVLFFTGVFQW